MEKNKCNLILIIGTNPLPNYVVAKYYENEIKRLILIYSEDNIFQEGTQKLARNIVQQFSNIESYYISISNIGDPNCIIEALKRRFSEIFNQNNKEKIHFNYTGGTKALVIYSYEFIFQYFGDDGIIIKSYLDAREYKLIIDDGEKIYESKDDLRNVINIDIDTLLSLHLYNKERLLNSEIIQPYEESLRIISEWNKEKKSNFLEWVNNTIRIIFKGKDGNIIEKTAKFLDHIKNDSIKKAIEIFNSNNNTNKFILELLNALSESEQITNNAGKLWIPPHNLHNKEFKNRISRTIKFLDGKWFEYYIYNQLQNVLRDRGLEEKRHYGLSLEAKKIVNGNGARKFELDIFLIRGYQLVAISVTTAKKLTICKSKGFEVIHRARQIGGEESRAILVTVLNDGEKRDLETDLSFVTGVASKKFLIYGLNDLDQIGKKIVEEVFKN
ncbi:MAG: DUF1887 domain-containing protein [Promethearchaeota archaeon]